MIDQMTRKVLREKEAAAKREEVERERVAAEERKRIEDAEPQRIAHLVREYQDQRDAVKMREAELRAIDEQINALGADMPALWSRWEAFNQSRAAHLWRQELKSIWPAGVPRPSSIPPGFSPDDMQRLRAYDELRRERGSIQGFCTDARTRMNQFETQEPALRVIGDNK